MDRQICTSHADARAPNLTVLEPQQKTSEIKKPHKRSTVPTPHN
uniref:Uncharacterized protein n=1 Tax=Escherichia coli TaxID=562 RepID=A0A7U1HRF2_ECOLX|nr:hypothetical protein [Escherichia coli]QRG45059.1 hypothetical protein [Escherichia coli]UMW90834.1 hypothetical protein [Escherichia coli]